MKSLILSSAIALSSALAGGSASEAAPLTVVALAKVLPGEEAAFRAAADGLVTGTQTEAGNISFEYHQSIKDPTEFAFVERWTTAEAIDAHFETAHAKTFFTAVKAKFVAGYPQIGTYK